MVSSSFLHIMHIDGSTIPLLHKFSQVRMRPLSTNQIKRVILDQCPWLQSLTHNFSEGRAVASLIRLVASLILKLPVG